MKNLFALGVFCLGLSPLLLFAATAVPPTDQMLRMVNNEQFDQLEKLMTEYRSQKTEFYQGPIPLRVAYDELDGLNRNSTDDIWQAYLAKLEKWKAAYPESPTPLVVLGKVYTSWAWKARGSGYANTVTDEGWRLMRERLAKAREYLETADKLSVRDAEIYRALLQVAVGQGWSKDEMDAAFKKGIALDPNYVRLYEAKAYFLLPRWHGDPGEWEAFAKEAADSRGGDEGDILYMHIARSQAWTEGTRFFQNTDIDYNRMKRGFETLLNRQPGDLFEENSFCYFACIAGDRKTAKELFGTIGGRWQQEVWGNQNYFDQWRQWASGGGSQPAYYPARPARHINWGRIGSIFGGVFIGSLLLVGLIIGIVSRRAPKSGA